MSVSSPPNIAIVTRNAIHGGVETMIALHHQWFGARIFVAGGHNLSATCPFPYTYIDGVDPLAARIALEGQLAPFDVVLYHWVPAWAQAAIWTVAKPSIEVVHREDTSDSDKTLPTLLVTHSRFLAEFIRHQSGREAVVIPYGIDVDRFPAVPPGRYVGAITSYYLTKGIDLFLTAWARLQPRFPEQKVRFYGAGKDLPRFRQMAIRLGLGGVEFLDAIAAPERHLGDFRLFVQPSRIEGMPLALLEALASNVPVVCSDLPGMVEFNRLAKERGVPPPLVLFRSEDTDDLGAKLTAQLSRPQAAGDTRSYITRYYGADTHCGSVRAAIDRAIDLHRAAPPRPPAPRSPWLARLQRHLRTPRWYPILKRALKQVR